VLTPPRLTLRASSYVLLSALKNLCRLNCATVAVPRLSCCSTCSTATRAKSSTVSVTANVALALGVGVIADSAVSDTAVEAGVVVVVAGSVGVELYVVAGIGDEDGSNLILFTA